MTTYTRNTWLTRRSFGCAFLVLALAYMLTMTLTATAEAGVSFKGKRVVWIVPSRESGGTDVMTRYLAPFFKKHLPGNPTIVIQNIPGTGTVPGINKVWHSAKGDGLMVLSLTTGGQTNYAFGSKTVQYDLRKLVVLMGLPQGTFVYAQPGLGVTGPGDVKALQTSGKTYLIGGTSPTSAEIRMLVTWEALGVKTKPVWGLSRGKTRKAFMRREVQLNYDTASGWLKKAKPLVRKKKAVPLFTLGVERADGTIVRDPTAPDLPTFLEVYEKSHGKKLTGLPYKAWYTTFSIAVMNSKAVVLHPKTKPEIVAAYRKAVEDVLNDPEFKKSKKKRLGTYAINTGKRAQQILLAGAAIDPKVCDWLTDFLKTKHDTDITCKR